MPFRMFAPVLFVSITLSTMAGMGHALPGENVSVEWSQWRGPKRDGKSSETGLLKRWPKGGPTLVWRATGLGGGYSTPSLAGGKLFGMSYRGDDEVVWALDAKTGHELWAARIAPAARVDYGQGSRSTPTVDGERLYALGVSGDLVCLDVATGAELWHRNLEKDFGGRRPSWGYSESVLVDGDRLVCTPGSAAGTVVALHKQTGVLAWQSKEFTDGPAYASLVATDAGGVRQYVQMTHGSVAGVAAESGKLLWRFPRNGPTAAVPTPIVSGDNVYATSGYGAGCHLIKLVRGAGSIKPEAVYANETMTNHHGGVVLVGDYLYGFSDSKGWVCQKLNTGELVWADRGKLGKGSICYADGSLYLRSERGTVALIEASPAGYVEKGRFEQPDRSPHQAWPHPVVAGGRLFLRDQDILLCYDVKGDSSKAESAGSGR